MATATSVMSERRQLGWWAKGNGYGGKGNHDSKEEGDGMEEGDGNGNKEGNSVEEDNGKGGKSDGDGNEDGVQQRGQGRQRGIPTRLAKGPNVSPCHRHCRRCHRTRGTDATALFWTSPYSTHWGGAHPAWGAGATVHCQSRCIMQGETGVPPTIVHTLPPRQGAPS
jgi:hypothetical protein